MAVCAGFPGTRPSSVTARAGACTRISEDPIHGVVDADCRVHGSENLYAAGSSVFPSAGFSNPTLTIVALAVRLAEHLESKG